MHVISNDNLCWNSDLSDLTTEGKAVNCNGGSWTTPSAKIGLMYASDYALSLGSSALALTSGEYSNRSLLKTSWMHSSNNDIAKDTTEWTIANDGFSSYDWFAWLISDDGSVGPRISTRTSGVRPVFYLTSDVRITADGDGSLGNPFIISE